MKAGLTLIIPCYNESMTIENCVLRCLALQAHAIDLQLLIVDDGSTDNSVEIIERLQQAHPEITLFRQPQNKGKGAALRAGFLHADKEFVGIQDADSEYDPLDYLEMLKPLLEGKADIVYGSRYLRISPRRTLRYWHTCVNKGLTWLTAMFTDMDITDMETCYKLFRREVIQAMAPKLQEDRFGFEPEITCLIARHNYRLYECAIDYQPRGYAEGKKIGWKDGLRALYCILHYGAPFAPGPIQFLIYFFIGAICASANILLFSFLILAHVPIVPAVIVAFALAALLNYILCLMLLFRHKSRWSAPGELASYIMVVVIMGLLDLGVTVGLTWFGLAPLASKTISTLIGFVGNFLLRKYIVFSTPGGV